MGIIFRPYETGWGCVRPWEGESPGVAGGPRWGVSLIAQVGAPLWGSWGMPSEAWLTLSEPRGPGVSDPGFTCGGPPVGYGSCAPLPLII